MATKTVVKAAKYAGFIVGSIVLFNLYMLFDRAFITHTEFSFDFVGNVLRPAFLSTCIAFVYQFIKKGGIQK